MFDFNTLANRSNIGNLKYSLLPESLRTRGLIGFAGAEMDFQTAPVIVQALTRFARRGLFGYTLPDEPYLQAIVWWMNHARNLKITPDEIVPTLGTMFSLGTAVRAFTEPGDGVIIQHPGYYRYEARLQSNGRRVISAPLIETNGVYSIDFSQLEQLAAKPENRMFVLCNPHNPTGKVFNPGELEELSRLARQHDLTVFSDEIFGEITYAHHTAVPFVDICPEKTVLCTSLGKVFNLTGVNHANVIIRDRQMRERFTAQRFADHFGSIDPFFYTALRAGYSPEGFAWVTEMRDYVWENYRTVQKFFSERLPTLRVSPLEGSFIIWINMNPLGLTEEELKEFLKKEALLIADEGWEYGPGGSGFIRMNIATPRERLSGALDNLEAACRQAGLPSLPGYSLHKKETAHETD